VIISSDAQEASPPNYRWNGRANKHRTRTKLRAGPPFIKTLSLSGFEFLGVLGGSVLILDSLGVLAVQILFLFLSLSLRFDFLL